MKETGLGSNNEKGCRRITKAVQHKAAVLIFN